MKEKAIQTAVLPNGLRIIQASSPTDVVYCGYAIDAGTRDELPSEHGLAHFVEHTLFKGTRKRSAWHILNRMENVGGDLNAYTNKEETVIYASCLRKDFRRAIELLSDIVFNCTFPQKEIPGELGVILDEIESYEDSPSELIFDDFENILFAGHPLGHNILGTPRKLRTFTSQSALNFTSRYYHPANAVLFVYGNISLKRILNYAALYTEGLPSGTALNDRKPPVPHPASHVVRHRHTHQTHVLMGCEAYPSDDPRRTGLYLLNNLLGGPGMNSRLNVALREHLGLVYNVESNLTGYTDTGVFNIYFGCNPSDAPRCIELTFAELQRLKKTPLSSLQLHAAKKQLIGQLGVAADNFENNALAMGKTFLHYNKYQDTATLYARIEVLTASSLQDIAQEVFAENHLTTLIYE
ncbi:MAG: insulinase family protein [Bacteroidaceae bacterium]|nr:insulinase family protein [Bacteroidaceae bacterium]